MKYLLYLFIFAPVFSDAQCPYELLVEGDIYCIELNWENGETKMRGKFKETNTLSPYLIPTGDVPQKWIYSKAALIVWKKEDPKQTSTEIPDFRVFPYMHMDKGHHHSTGYEFFFDSVNQYYILRRVGFQQMKGCWSLRWTTSNSDDMSTSQLLQNITEFTNLNENQIIKQENHCPNMSN